MVYCFVHAPIHNGWAGEILLVKKKQDGFFRAEDIRKITDVLYPNEDWDDLIWTPHPSLYDVEKWEERRANGMMQRCSSAKTFEDLHFDEWMRAIRKNCKGVYTLLEMVLGV